MTASRTSVNAPDPLIGSVIEGRYRLEEVLAAGGVAVIYRAEHMDLERPVAIKVLQERFGAHHELRERFKREARALAGMSHPNVVGVMDYGISEQMPYLVMELLRGRTLRALMDEGPIPYRRVVHIMRQILRAISFAHASSVLHRDIKPGNVFLQVLPDNDDHVKILDFGFAKFVAGHAAGDGQNLTAVGKAFGTPSYMAPEQVIGSRPDGRVDLYAAATIFFEMLTGTKPFHGDIKALLMDKLQRPAPTLAETRPDLVVVPELEQLMAKGLALRPEDRFESADVFLAALEALPPDAIGAPSRLPAPSVAPPTPDGLGSHRNTMVLALAGLGVLSGIAACAVTATVFLTRPDAAGHPKHTSGSGVDMVLTGDEDQVLDLPDPWSEPAAPALVSLRSALEAGDAVEDRALEPVRAYRRTHPDDARPLLLLGHVFSTRGWRSDALDHYARAHETDPAARGDRRMVTNLVALAAHPEVGERAGRMVREIYGREAIGTIDAALALGSLTPPGAERLQALRESIQ